MPTGANVMFDNGTHAWGPAPVAPTNTPTPTNTSTPTPTTKPEDPTNTPTPTTKPGDPTNTPTPTTGPNPVEVESLTMDPANLELTVDETAQLTVRFTPENATNKHLTWSTNFPAVVTVDQNGKIKAVGEGNATITATADNGKSCTCKIVVEEVILSSTPTPTTKPGDPTNTPTPTTKPGDPTNTPTPTEAVKPTDSPSDIAVESLSMWPASLDMMPGDSQHLTVRFTPENATNKHLTWTSNFPSIVSVDADGFIKALGEGNVTITATADNGKFCTCKIRVEDFVPTNTPTPTLTNTPTPTEKPGTVTVIPTEAPVTPTPVEAESITLSKTSLSMEPGDAERLTATVKPVNATDPRVTWRSSNTAVVTVSEGLVTAVGAGNATVYAETSNGVKAACKISVDVVYIPTPTNTVTPTPTSVPAGDPTPTPEPTAAPIELTDIVLSMDKVTMEPGDSFRLIASFVPENADNTHITWTSGNLAVASVDETGLVTAVGPGNVTIYAIADNGIEKSCKIRVEAPYIPPTATPTPTAAPPTSTPTPIPTTAPEVESVALNRATLTLKPGESFTLEAEVLPADAVDAEIAWKSGNTKVCKVSSTGRLTAVAAGIATIRAMTANGTKDYCYVTVESDEVTEVTLNKSSASINVGLTVQLKASCTPEDAEDTTVTWKSSNTKIAKVSSKGLVTAVRGGTAKITATAKSGAKATCIVTVKPVYVYECEKNNVYRYTTSTSTVKELKADGWTYKKAFRAAGKSQNPIYWIYNKTTKRYQYTAVKSTAVAAKKAGNKAGLAFYGSASTSIPVYELCKEGKRPTYFYTTSKAAAKAMKKQGWEYKGIGWYAEPKPLD